MIVSWSLKIIDQLMTMNIFVNVLLRTSSRCQFFNLFQLFLNKIFNDQLFRRRRQFIERSIFLTRQNNWWQRVFQNSFKSREKEFWIIIAETDRRIAWKTCKQKSIYISFEKWKTMKSKTTFFDRYKNNFDINDCDEWFFWLLFSLFAFEKEIELSATTLFVI